MLFDDLSPYQYKISKPMKSILNIGWLNNNDFSTGVISIEFLNKLECLVNCGQEVDIHFNIVRGISPCEVCGKREVTTTDSPDATVLGMSEILIPDKNNQVFYASPSMVMHYIKDHNYLPPKCFIDSVLNFSFESYCAEDIFEELLIQSGK